jgi:hypothetical protein
MNPCLDTSSTSISNGSATTQPNGFNHALARAVVAEMKEAGVLLFAGGLVEEIESAVGITENGEIRERITADGEFMGGLTIIEVESDEEANKWGAKVGQACGWPQEVRKFK